MYVFVGLPYPAILTSVNSLSLKQIRGYNSTNNFTIWDITGGLGFLCSISPIEDGSLHSYKEYSKYYLALQIISLVLGVAALGG